MSKWKPWLVLAVIFVAGVITGSALTMALGPHFMPPHGAKQMKQDWLNFLTRELNLTPDQQAKIEPILADAGSQLQLVHREEIWRASQIMRVTNSKIASILTPEQLAQLQKIENEMDRRHAKMFPGQMGPMGMGPRGGFGRPNGFGGGDMPLDQPPPPPPLPIAITNSAPQTPVKP